MEERCVDSMALCFRDMFSRFIAHGGDHWHIPGPHENLSYGIGLVALPTLAALVGWVRRKSERGAKLMLLALSMVGAAGLAWAEHNWIWFFPGLIVCGLISQLIWCLSSLFFRGGE